MLLVVLNSLTAFFAFLAAIFFFLGSLPVLGFVWIFIGMLWVVTAIINAKIYL